MSCEQPGGVKTAEAHAPATAPAASMPAARARSYGRWMRSTCAACVALSRHSRAAASAIGRSSSAVSSGDAVPAGGAQCDRAEAYTVKASADLPCRSSARA